MRTRGIRRGSTVIVALMVALAACGSDSTSNDPAPPADDTESTTAPADSSATPAVTTAPDSDDDGDDGTAAAGDAEWDAIVAAANEEGAVTLYSSQGVPQLEELERLFEVAYPDIDMTFVRGFPQDFVPRLEVERESGRGEAGVYVSADQQWVVDADADGWYSPMVGPNADNPDFDREQGMPNGTYFNTAAVVFGFGWNTDDVPDGLSSYEDLLDPSLAGGRVGVVEASNQTLVDFYVYLEEEYGEQFVIDLAAQSPRIYPGSAAIAEAVASGEISAAAYTGGPLLDLQAVGAPVDLAYPERPFGAIFWAGVLDSAPNPNAAQVLANFMIGVEGQTAMARTAVAVIPGIPDTVTDIANVRRQDLDLLTPEFVADYQEKWRQLFQ